jgi:hypothetical protein
MVVKMKSSTFWEVMLYIPVDVYQMAWCNIPEDVSSNLEI